MLTGSLWSPVSLALMNVVFFLFFFKGVKITPILLPTQKTIKDAKILFLPTTNGDWCEEGATGDKEGQWRSLQKHIHSAQFKEAALKGAGVMKVQQGGSLPQNQPHRLFSRSNKIRLVYRSGCQLEVVGLIPVFRMGKPLLSFIFLGTQWNLGVLFCWCLPHKI